MKYFIFSIMLFILLFSCGSEPKDDELNNLNRVSKGVVIPVSKLLSLEMSFNEKSADWEDEFLLALPNAIHVKDNGDILVVDEGMIKVYDKFGKSKKIIGRQGHGPGEFEGRPRMFLSPTGYLVVISLGSYYYNLFAPDYSFVEKKRFSNSQPVIKMYALNESEKVYEVIDNIRNENKNYILIFYENNDIVIPLLQCKNPEIFEFSSGISSGIYQSRWLGGVYWELLPDRRIIYINTDEDTHDKKTGSKYTIHIISLDTFEDKKITRQFTPVEFPDKLKKSSEDHPKKVANFYKDKKYYSSVHSMKVDQKYVFIETGSNIDIYNNVNITEIAVDLFDFETDSFIKQVNYPERPFLSGQNNIKNGYLYVFGSDVEGFAEIRKYKINPAVYGK